MIDAAGSAGANGAAQVRPAGPEAPPGTLLKPPGLAGHDRAAEYFFQKNAYISRLIFNRGSHYLR